MGEPRNRYSTVSLLMHWGIAAAVLAQVLLITAHENTEGPISGQFVMLHKSLGLTILVLTLGVWVWVGVTNDQYDQLDRRLDSLSSLGDVNTLLRSAQEEVADLAEELAGEGI